MKILYQSTSFVPSHSANSIHVMNMVGEFVNKGNEVYLIALKGDMSPIEGIFKYYGTSEPRKIFFLPYNNIYQRLMYLLRSLVYAYSVKPDLIVSRSHVGSFMFLLLGYKVILDAHRPIWSSKLKSGLWRIFRKFGNLRVTTNSNGLKKMFEENGLSPSHPITVAFNGATPKPTDELLFHDGTTNNVGYVGGLYQGRGIDTIMALAAKLTDVNFHIAGGNTRDIDNLKHKYGTLGNVIFYGQIAPSLVHRFRNSCDILLAPYSKIGVMSYGLSTDDQSLYQNPIKVIEYLSAGKPIIASDIESIRDIVSNETAMLVDPDNINEWSEAICLLLNDKYLRDRLSKNAYNHYIHSLTWEARAQKMIELSKGI